MGDVIRVDWELRRMELDDREQRCAIRDDVMGAFADALDKFGCPFAAHAYCMGMAFGEESLPGEAMADEVRERLGLR